MSLSEERAVHFVLRGKRDALERAEFLLRDSKLGETSWMDAFTLVLKPKHDVSLPGETLEEIVHDIFAIEGIESVELSGNI